MQGSEQLERRGATPGPGSVYRRRDPALLEWMQGNLFRIRIFPLEARQEKRLFLSYTQTLERLYDTYQLRVPLPAVDNHLRRADFNVRLVGGAHLDATSSSHEITTRPDGDDLLVLFDDKNVATGDDFILSIRDPGAEAATLTVHT